MTNKRAKTSKPSKAGTRSTACDGKVKFNSFTEADRSLRAAMRHDGAADTKMGVYRCRFCQRFHIGHGYFVTSRQVKEAKRA